MKESISMFIKMVFNDVVLVVDIRDFPRNFASRIIKDVKWRK